MHIHIFSLSLSDHIQYLGQGLLRTQRRKFQIIFLTLLLSRHLFYPCSLSLSILPSVKYFFFPLWWPAYSHIAFSFRLLLFLSFFFFLMLPFLVYICCTFLWTVMFFSAVVCWRWSGGDFYTSFRFSRMLYHWSVLFWISIFPHCVVYYISGVNGKARELNWMTQTSAVCVCSDEQLTAFHCP